MRRKAFRLALRAEDAVRDVETFERRVFAGAISVTISSVKLAGTAAIVSVSSVN